LRLRQSPAVDGPISGRARRHAGYASGFSPGARSGSRVAMVARAGCGWPPRSRKAGSSTRAPRAEYRVREKNRSNCLPGARVHLAYRIGRLSLGVARSQQARREVEHENAADTNLAGELKLEAVAL